MEPPLETSRQYAIARTALNRDAPADGAPGAARVDVTLCRAPTRAGFVAEGSPSRASPSR